MTPSFSTQVKQELNHVPHGRTCCHTAELAAAFRGAGSFHLLPGDRFGIEAAFSLSASARRALSLLRYFDMPVEVRVREEPRLRQGKRYEIYLEGSQRLVQFLNEIGVLSDRLSLQEKLPARILARQCCRNSFLRGAFLACGSVSGPGAAAHLEVYSGNEQFLQTVIETAKQQDINLRLIERRKNAAAYTKSVAQVRDFLVATGAHQAALLFEQRDILSSVRGDANRRANFDQANAARCSAAAARQVRAIRGLMAGAAWQRLSESLREIGELRLRYPSLTIAELGLRADPPLQKSAVNHRLRRLLAAAETR